MIRGFYRIVSFAKCDMFLSQIAMPLPKLHDAEIAWVIQQVVEYIGQQRH
jgi:hypothetical protein